VSYKEIVEYCLFIIFCMNFTEMLKKMHIINPIKADSSGSALSAIALLVTFSLLIPTSAIAGDSQDEQAGRRELLTTGGDLQIQSANCSLDSVYPEQAGIPESEIASLSRPFERASNSPLANVRGMGIGLSISQRIISGHGGRLFCRSEEKSGSEFSVFLQAYR